MSSGSIVKADPTNPTTLEFDISIEGAGIKRKSSAIVRFVLHTKQDGDRMFVCKNTSDTLWSVTLPALKEFAKSTLTYTIEVIVDGYFFEPAEGDIVISANPKVKASAKKADKELTEASGGPEITGQFAPTNDLLKPEYKPADSHAKAPGTEKDDELIDKTKLSDLGLPVPGEGTESQAEGDNTHELVGEFDPKDVVAQILKDRVGNVKRPAVKGSLFKRDAEGRPVVEGLSSPDQEAEREARSAKVREILRSTT